MDAQTTKDFLDDFGGWIAEHGAAFSALMAKYENRLDDLPMNLVVTASAVGATLTTFGEVLNGDEPEPDKYDGMSKSLLQDIYRGETMEPWRDILPLSEDELRRRLRELRGEPKG